MEVIDEPMKSLLETYGFGWRLKAGNYHSLTGVFTTLEKRRGDNAL